MPKLKRCISSAVVHAESDGLSAEVRWPQCAYPAASAGHFELAAATRAHHADVDAEHFYTPTIKQSNPCLAVKLRRDKPDPPLHSWRKGQRREPPSVRLNDPRDAFHDHAWMRCRVGRNPDALLDVAEGRAQTDPELPVWVGGHVAPRNEFLAAEHAAAWGEGGYETQGIALLLRGSVHQSITHGSRAERVLERVLSRGHELGPRSLEFSGRYNRGAFLSVMGNEWTKLPNTQRAK